MTPRAAAVALAVLAAASPARTAPLQDAASLLAGSGLEPLRPSRPAEDFTLEDLQGRQVSLADHRGDWVLLTFWAPWCGPCRSELASLQDLYLASRDGGFTVLTIATGSARGTVRDAVERRGLGFPVLLDPGGKVAAAYGASGIPVTFLVSPDGDLVGVARGARDWSAAAPALSRLAEGSAGAVGDDGDAGADGEDAPDRGGVTLAVEVDRATVRAGTMVELRVRARWTGRPGDYAIDPPRVTLPDGIEEVAMAVSTDDPGADHRTTFTVTLRALRPGRYSLGPVELAYRTADGVDGVETAPGPQIEIVAESSGTGWRAVVAGCAALAAVAGAVALVVRGRRRAQGGG